MAVAGWWADERQATVAYLIEENRILRARLCGRIRLYDPAAPHDARAKRALYYLPLILGRLGVLLLGAALGVLLLLRTIPHQAPR